MDDRTSARKRALRAARAVTLGLAMAAIPACAASSEGDIDSGPGTDAFRTEEDAGGSDAGSPGEDAGTVADAGGSTDSGIPELDGGLAQEDAAVADAGSIVCPPIFPPTTKECCEATPGGFWDEASMTCAVAVPGPFVPPELVA
jgi:hypothetical protein